VLRTIATRLRDEDVDRPYVSALLEGRLLTERDVNVDRTAAFLLSRLDRGYHQPSRLVSSEQVRSAELARFQRDYKLRISVAIGVVGLLATLLIAYSFSVSAWRARQRRLLWEADTGAKEEDLYVTSMGRPKGLDRFRIVVQIALMVGTVAVGFLLMAVLVGVMAWYGEGPSRRADRPQSIEERETMMGERFTRALVRPPTDAYAHCLRPEDVVIDPSKARVQHRAYAAALRDIGVEVRELGPLDLHDAVFVEDTAVALGDRVVLTRPGAMTRRQELMTVLDFFEEEGIEVGRLDAGTLDGGDVMKVGGYVLIGLSERTDQDGAAALAAHVREASMTPVEVPVTDRIHLKTTCSALDAVTILATEATALPELAGVRVLRVPPGHELAANCVAFRRSVVLPAGHAEVEALLRDHGYAPVPVDLSQFEAGGGGATCLSVRY
jgi:dimethylargininase